MLKNISKALVRGQSAFLTITPSPVSLLKFKWAKHLLLAPRIIKEASHVIKGQSTASETLQNLLGNYVGNLCANRGGLVHIHGITNRAFAIAQERPNWKLQGLGATRRTWVTVNDRDFRDQRIVKKLVIVYHHANKAGKHIDVHLGHLSLVYRVSGKPFEKDLKFNNQGRLTEASKQLLLNHVRQEISKNARVPQNHDHTISNAKSEWSYDPDLSEVSGYGSGPTRQIILEDKVEFYHPDVKSSLHLYAPALNPDQGLYLYRIHDGKTPILIFGKLIPLDSNFKDRLHLKMVLPKDVDKIKDKANWATSTEKIDGGSCYISSNGQGMKIFSPRISKITNHRIEYTWKAPQLANTTTNLNYEAMGEITFERNIPFLPSFLRRLSAAQTGGVLNSNAVVPRNIVPRIWLYRVDKFDGKQPNMEFFANRKIQQRISSVSKYLSIVPYRSLQLTKLLGMEGVVIIPKGASVNDGYKIKHADNFNDWRLDQVNLSLSPKGHIQGVCNFISLESGKIFKLGPSNIGNFDTNMEIMDNPKKFIGKVYKVASRRGGEGRASKIIEEHLDK